MSGAARERGVQAGQAEAARLARTAGVLAAKMRMDCVSMNSFCAVRCAQSLRVLGGRVRAQYSSGRQSTHSAAGVRSSSDPCEKELLSRPQSSVFAGILSTRCITLRCFRAFRLLDTLEIS